MSFNKFPIHADGRAQRPTMIGAQSGGWNGRNSIPSSLSPSHYLPNELPSVHFRSAAEASLDSSSKFRQLPCKTLIAVGTCPYGERCVFLHDPRLICHTTHSISRLKNKEDNVVDSFFWPLSNSTEQANAMNGHGNVMNNKKSEHNFRPYNIPPPNNDQFKLHDQALYSIWMHYVEFCRVTSKEQKSAGISPKMSPQDLPINVFTQTRRLPVFQLLSSSNGNQISREQFYLASYEQPLESVNACTSPDMNMMMNNNNTSAIVQSIPMKVVGRSQSPTSVHSRHVFSPDERFPDMMHALSKQNSREKMMFHQQMSRHRSHSGEISSGFPSYMSECDDSTGEVEEWNSNNIVPQMMIGSTQFDQFTQEQSWVM